MEKRLKEIQDRKLEIRSALTENQDFNHDEVLAELETLQKEELEIRSKQEIARKINADEISATTITKPEERKMEINKFETVEYRNAFMNHVLKGAALPQEFRSATATADVGAVIPTTILNKVVDKLYANGMILPLVTKTSFKGGLAIPTSSVKPAATWVAEGATSEKLKKTTGSIVFAYHKLRCAVAVTLETDTMALSAFEAAIIQNISEAMTVALEQAIVSGDGNGKPEGILNETPASAVEVSKIDYKTLVKAEGELALEYENRAVWCMTKKTFMEFVGMTDTAGQPIARVNYGVEGKVERSLLGRQVVLCNYVDSYASASAGEAFAFLFDFSDYVLNTNFNISMKKYEDNETEDQVTKAIMIADGKVVSNGSLVVLKKPVA